MAVYAVAAILGPTLQGEGPHLGRPCLILRLAGCNAWDGRLDTKPVSVCPACDTDFRMRWRLSGEEILRRLGARLGEAAGPPSPLGCILTGGEPLLQADAELLAALGATFAWVDIETNGTYVCPPRPANAYVSCSPKAVPGWPLVADPDWWKILIPRQEGFLECAAASGKPVYVQPECPAEGLTSAVYRVNLQRCLDLCYHHGFILSPQLHKWLGIE